MNNPGIFFRAPSLSRPAGDASGREGNYPPLKPDPFFIGAGEQSGGHRFIPGGKEEKKRVDLHLHTTASDGIYPPEKVIALAARAGLAAVSITDHDTLDGLGPALAAGTRYGIEVVPGVEVSCAYAGEEVHLLGYYPDRSGPLGPALEEMRRDRVRRMQRMLDRLRGLGVKLAWEEVEAEMGEAAPGRLHLARLLVKKKLVHTIEEAFKYFLGNGCPAYVSRRHLPAAEAVRLLLAGGAVPVLAHPGPGGKAALEALLRHGLKGVEVFHPEHTPAVQRYYCRLAQDKGLLITGGSDFHGDYQSSVRRPGQFTVPYRCLKLLRAASGEHNR